MSTVSHVTDTSLQEAVAEIQRTLQIQAVRTASEAPSGAPAPATLPVVDRSTAAANDALTPEMVAMMQAQRAANRSVSIVQTAQAGLNEFDQLLTRMRELATQATSETMSPAQRTDAGAAYQALAAQAHTVVRDTTYSGEALLNGSDTVDTDIVLPNISEAERVVARSGIDQPQAASQALASLNRAIADVGNMRRHLSDSSFALQAATIRTLDQQVDLGGADAATVDTAYAIATNALVSVRVQQQAAHLVATVANQMPEAAMALLYVNGAANGGR